jgi:hypothetical protein
MTQLLFFFFALVCFSYRTPAQIIKTSLQITVRNDLGNLEPGVTIHLYKTKEDFEKVTNAAAGPLQTDKNGKLTFKELEPIEYFISAEKGDMNNSGGGEKTEKLDANRINKITIVVSDN